VTRTFRDAEWLSYAVSTVAHPDGLYGPGGATAETYGATATLKLVAGTASEVELYYLAQRGGGTIKVSADGAEVIRVDTRAEQKAAERAVATVAGGAARFRLEAAKGRARVFGIALENRTGAVVDNLGIVSANVLNFAQRDTAHFTAALAQRGADLAIIMLGANEARWLSPRDQDTKQYQARFERAIEPLRKARPGASCLVVAPTDQAEVVDGSYRSRPVMPVLVGAQRRAAHAQGCAFFDTYRWMGGKGSAVRWNRGGLLGGDFTHLSIKGAHRLADAVHDALMTGHHRDARP
jgi:lysophospholipase L1-like esterase